MEKTVIGQIMNRVNRKPKGSVVTPTDFSNLGKDNTVRQSIYKLEKSGMLMSIGNGMYKKPNYNELLKREIPVEPALIAEAYARKRNWIIYPSKNWALNSLGLSTQGPNVYTYNSSGPTTEININGTSIEFKKINSNNISSNMKSNIIIEGIRFIGKANINKNHLLIIKSILSTQDMKDLLKDSEKSTIWIREKIKEMENI